MIVVNKEKSYMLVSFSVKNYKSFKDEIDANENLGTKFNFFFEK